MAWEFLINHLKCFCPIHAVALSMLCCHQVNTSAAISLAHGLKFRLFRLKMADYIMVCGEEDGDCTEVRKKSALLLKFFSFLVFFSFTKKSALSQFFSFSCAHPIYPPMHPSGFIYFFLIIRIHISQIS